MIPPTKRESPGKTFPQAIATIADITKRTPKEINFFVMISSLQYTLLMLSPTIIPFFS